MCSYSVRKLQSMEDIKTHSHLLHNKLNYLVIEVKLPVFSKFAFNPQA